MEGSLKRVRRIYIEVIKTAPARLETRRAQQRLYFMQRVAAKEAKLAALLEEISRRKEARA